MTMKNVLRELTDNCNEKSRSKNVVNSINFINGIRYTSIDKDTN